MKKTIDDYYCDFIEYLEKLVESGTMSPMSKKELVAIEIFKNYLNFWMDR